MKTRELVAVALRLLALYLFFLFLFDLPQSLQAMLSVSPSVMDDSWMALPVSAFHLSVMVFAYIPFSALLFVKADKVSRLFVKDSGKEAEVSGKVSDDMQILVFRCFGVYALILWAPTLVQALFQAVIYETWLFGHALLPQRAYENWSNLVSPAVGVSIGAWLVFSKRGIARLIIPGEAFRNVGGGKAGDVPEHAGAEGER